MSSILGNGILSGIKIFPTVYESQDTPTGGYVTPFSPGSFFDDIINNHGGGFEGQHYIMEQCTYKSAMMYNGDPVGTLIGSIAPTMLENTDRYNMYITGQDPANFSTVATLRYVNNVGVVKEDNIITVNMNYANASDNKEYFCWVPVRFANGKTGFFLQHFHYHYNSGQGAYEITGGENSIVFIPETLSANDHQSLLPVDYDFDDEKYGDPSQDDGYDQHSSYHNSDTIGLPPDPIFSTADTGFMHIYRISSGVLSTLGQYLFPSPFNITDVTSALRAIAGIFGYRDSIQYIVDLHAIPVQPTVGSNDYIKIGALSTDISAPVCSSDYVTFDCGSLSLEENFHNFLDYLTKAKLFLPFVGFVDINPEYWIGGTIQVKYKFNIVDGSFMAYVLSTSGKSNLSNSIIGQYGGSACLHMPVIAASYGALASGLVQGAGQLAGLTPQGTVVGAISGAVSGGQQQPQMAQSNNYNASTSYMGVRRPYLLIERMVPSFSRLYPHDKGLPCNVVHSLSEVHGFTQIEDIDLSGLPGASADEIRELKDMLAAGVYL